MKRKHFLDLILLIAALIYSAFLKFLAKYRNVWLISERQTDAGDNGYHFFSYIRNNHPEINAYYVITDNSLDRYKIAHLKNTISPNNKFSHILFLVLAKYIIGAHGNMGIPKSGICWRYLSKSKKPLIFIQHGITKEDCKHFHYKRTNYSLFMTGAQPEYDFISKNFGYPASNVVYSGLCRFDALHDSKVKKQILLMPTWRAWLKISQTFGNSAIYRDEFINSEYYQVYQRLINSPELHELLVRKGYELLFFPHHEIQGCLDLFTTKSPLITIADEMTYDVQELLKESAIMITDFSSVAFDFAYMRKPVLYYQFDEEQYYNSHSQKGYFDYYKHGFGPVVKDESTLIQQIELIFKQGQIENSYTNRSINFFPLYDQKNCKRTFEAILALDKK
ncbi:MAG: CDP-glycerol glycerophosphotransferase family protein [Phocaeicola sp.]